MTEYAIRAALRDDQVVALTAWAEARGDSTEGRSSVEERIAVMCVIRTRAATPGRWANNVRSVCLGPKQFSCWNPGADANHQRLLAAAAALLGEGQADALLVETLYLAGGVLNGQILDRVAGANSYYAPAAMFPRGRVPSWAVGQAPTAIVGGQRFYRL